MTKMNISIVYLLIALLALPCNAYGQAELSLPDALQEALKSNPEISAARRNYDAARTKISQELSPEDPMVEYSYDEIRAGVDGAMGKPMRSYAISQNAPFPTKLFLRSAIASKDARILYEAYKEKEREIIAKTKSAYFELWFAEKAININIENKALLEQFSSSAAARYAVGKTSQQDALKAQVELAKVNNSIVLSNQKFEIAKAKLNILLNRDPNANLMIDKDPKTSDITKPLDELLELAKKNRPRLRAFRYAVEKGRTAYLLAWNEFLPDVSMRYEQMIQNNRATKWAGMLGLSVPVWFLTKQAQGVSQMKSELEMFKSEYKMMENMALFDVKDAYTRVASQKKLVEIYETSFIPQAEAALKASLLGYEANQIDFLNLLDSQRMLLEVKLDYYNMVAELETAKAELEQAAGTDL